MLSCDEIELHNAGVACIYDLWPRFPDTLSLDFCNFSNILGRLVSLPPVCGSKAINQAFTSVTVGFDETKCF